METVSKFGERLLKLREERNETQQQLADAIGITRQSLSRYETNDRTPNIDLVYNIAKHYNVSADYLLGLSEIQSSDKKIETACEVTGLSEKSIQLINCHSNCFSEELNFVFQDYYFYELIKFLKKYAVAYKSKYNLDRKIFDETTESAITLLELQGFVVMTNAESNIYQCEQSFMGAALQILADMESLCDDEEFDIYEEYENMQKEKMSKMIKPMNKLVKEREENAEHNPTSE